ncbi:hypothetical protein Tco_0216715 [Tanacetum coccineum]
MPRATVGDTSHTKSYIPKVSEIPRFSPVLAQFYKPIENRCIHEGRVVDQLYIKSNGIERMFTNVRFNYLFEINEPIVPRFILDFYSQLKVQIDEHEDDDENDGASRTSTPSSTTYLNSLKPLDYQQYDIPTSFKQDDDLLFERQTDLLNQTQQMHKELRAPPPSPIRSLGYRAATIRMRAEAAATSHSLPLPPPFILSPTRPDAPPPLPTSAPTSFPPLLLPSDRQREDRPEVNLPPRMGLGIALGPRYEVGESSAAAAARPAGGFRADYGFVATMDREIRRDPERYVGYGITDSWDEIVETLQGAPVSTDTELGAHMREFESMVRRDTDEIYTRLDDEQGQRQLLAGRVNMLFRDRRTHAHTRQLMETEAGMSREAWGRAMDASDLAHGEVISLRTTVHAQMSEITELQSADLRRQRAMSDLLETDRRRREEMRELRAADRTRQQQIIQTLTVMQTLQREMIPLQGLVTTLQGQVTALQGQVMTLQGQVTALQGQQGPAGGPAPSS